MQEYNSFPSSSEQNRNLTGSNRNIFKHWFYLLECTFHVFFQLLYNVDDADFMHIFDDTTSKIFNFC